MRQERQERRDRGDNFSRLLGKGWEAMGDGTYRFTGDDEDEKPELKEAQHLVQNDE